MPASSRRQAYHRSTEESEHADYEDFVDSDKFWASNHKQKPPHMYSSKTYDPLPKARRFIRLLNLFSSSPNNPQIECELVMAEFDEKTGATDKKYEALSWCWGSAKAKSYINIRKGRKIYAKYVQPDLVSALRALRHPREDRYLWIDAICINQDNLLEKNHQVEMMSDIYGKAERVCIWLGDGDESSKTALTFIKKEVLQLQNFDELCKSEQASAKWSALLDLMQRPWFSRRWVVQEIALARKARIYCGDDKISWSKFAVAVELFVEVETATHRLSEVMKKDPKFYHVPGWFEYVSALGASLLVDATGKLFRDYKTNMALSSAVPVFDSDSESISESGSDMESESDSESDSNFGYLSDNEISDKPEAGYQAEKSEKGKSIRVEATTRAKPSLHNGTAAIPEPTSSVTHRNRGQPLFSLEYLVSSLSIFEATKNHDIIYALLPIAKDTTPSASDDNTQLVLDYTQHVLEVFTQKKRYKVEYEKPFVDVCKDFVQFCLERSLQTDPTRALDVICRPWAPEEEKVADGRHSTVSKKAKERKKKAVKNRTISIGDLEAREEPTSGDKQNVEEDLTLPSWIPRLSGASYAMYSHAGMHTSKMGRKNADSLVGLPTVTQRNYNAAETKGIDLKALKFRKRAGLKHYSLYVRGFVLDTIKEVHHSSQGGAIPQEWAKAGGWHKAPKSKPPDEFWCTLVANRGRDGRNPPVYYARACQESFLKGGFMSGSVNTTDLINNERCSVVAQFCRRVQAVIWNRSLIKTERGNLGLVGKNVLKGDLVCILYGCSVPVILRRRKNEKTEEEIDREIEEDILWWRKEFCTKLQAHQKRAKAFRAKRQYGKQRYKEWEIQKMEEWQKDGEWRNTWKQRQYNRVWWGTHEEMWAKNHMKGKPSKIHLQNDKEWWDCWEKNKFEELEQLKHIKTADLKLYESLQEKKAPWRTDKEWWKTWQQTIKMRRTESDEMKPPKNLQDLGKMNTEERRKWDFIREFYMWKLHAAKKKALVDREFNMWKCEKREIARNQEKEWDEPSPNWGEFELFLKYGRRWKNHWRGSKIKKTDDLAPLKNAKSVPSSASVNTKIHAQPNEGHDIEPEKEDNVFGAEGPWPFHFTGGTFETDEAKGVDTKKDSKRETMDRLQDKVETKQEHEKDARAKSLAEPVSGLQNHKESSDGDIDKDVGSLLVPPEPPTRRHTSVTEATLSTADKIKMEKELAEKIKIEKERDLVEKIKAGLKEDDRWHYESFGECYIHGMMDGEAMAIQNNSGLKAAVFEIR